MLVKDELKKLDIHFTTVSLGEAEITEDMTSLQRDQLKTALRRAELVLVDDKKVLLVKQIKSALVEMIHYTDETSPVYIAEYLSQKLNCKYAYLAKLFSESQAITIDHFVLHHKIERIKQLLIDEQMTISEIAWKLNYSSVGYLCNQFKKMTGLTPTTFKSHSRTYRHENSNVGII